MQYTFIQLCALVSFDITTNSLVHRYASFKISPEFLACGLQRKYKDCNLQKYNLFCFVRVRNLVSNIKGRM